jgi:DNA modification methylase
MSVQIINGDCREVLRTLPPESVHCCVTSPPYWGLRDYGVSGQIGLEATFTDFVAEMVGVFREVRRVLRPDGTLWLNLGDSYAQSTVRHREGVGDGGVRGPEWIDNKFSTAAAAGLKPKDLVGIPWRVAFALQADGWWLRQEIIWAKPNPMPESVTDRCTKSHEYIFLLTKSARYFFDAEAIREKPTGRTDPITSFGAAKLIDGKPRGGRDRTGGGASLDGTVGTNKRSVWTVATAPFSEAHFATFPPDLIEPCIKAGTSEKGCCGKCGAPWERKTNVTYEATDRKPAPNKGHLGAMGERAANMTRDGFVPNRDKQVQTLGWQPTCQCNAPVVPCTVLDPFGGAGTTGLVADRHQRNAILIELNPTYAAMAERRIRNDAPLFAEAVP